MKVDYSGTNVLITGASSGLGAEFARQLAARGANLILVARRADRMDALKAELEKAHDITATVIAADLTKPDAAADLGAQVRKLGLPVHSLINNAGFGSHNLFVDEDADLVHREVTLNVAVLVDLTKEFWVELLQHRKGVLINVASTAGFQPIPRMAIYGATKAFVLSFTEALWGEAKGTGVKVLALCPGATETEFFQVAGESVRTGPTQDAPTVIRYALNTLDRRNPPPSILSGVSNKLSAFAERLVSRRFVVTMAGRLTDK